MVLEQADVRIPSGQAQEPGEQEGMSPLWENDRGSEAAHQSGTFGI